MVSLADLEKPQIRIAMGITIILELYLIINHFNAGFEDYVTIVLILLALPLAYFLTLFLTNKYQSVKTYEAILRNAIPPDHTQETRDEVEKLLASE